jgi:hypothetical protein
MSTNFGGARKSQLLEELPQFSALSFCSLERGQKKEKNMFSNKQAASCWYPVPRIPGQLSTIKS